LTPANLISGFCSSGIYPLNPSKITAEKLAPSQATNPPAGQSAELSIDDILVVPEGRPKNPSTTTRKPGLVVSGRCITEAEFLKEMREREAQQIEAERQKQEQKAEKEKKKKEREAEERKKRNEKLKEKEKGEKKRLKRRRECKRGLQGGEEDGTKDRHEPTFQRRL